jgi:hypothetical protein
MSLPIISAVYLRLGERPESSTLYKDGIGETFGIDGHSGVIQKRQFESRTCKASVYVCWAA